MDRLDSLEQFKEYVHISKIVLSRFLATLSDREALEFQAAFHLRPRTTGIRLICTLLEAPMLGLRGRLTSECGLEKRLHTA